VVSDQFSDLFDEEPLADDACPVCRGVLTEKDGARWCANCELGFTP
jgi:uncharacterized Zn finger protein (UPF0148 family)